MHLVCLTAHAHIHPLTQTPAVQQALATNGVVTPYELQLACAQHGNFCNCMQELMHGYMRRSVTRQGCSLILYRVQTSFGVAQLARWEGMRVALHMVCNPGTTQPVLGTPLQGEPELQDLELWVNRGGEDEGCIQHRLNMRTKGSMMLIDVVRHLLGLYKAYEVELRRLREPYAALFQEHPIKTREDRWQLEHGGAWAKYIKPMYYINQQRKEFNDSLQDSVKVAVARGDNETAGKLQGLRCKAFCLDDTWDNVWERGKRFAYVAQACQQG